MPWSLARRDPEPAGERPRNPLLRAVGLPGRTILLIALGVLLVVLFATGSCRGIDISEAQAVATARSALAAHPGAFTPENTEAQVLRQGFPPNSMWVVVFIVPEPDGGSEDFLHRAAVWVNANSGELEQINVDDPGGG